MGDGLRFGETFVSEVMELDVFSFAQPAEGVRRRISGNGRGYFDIVERKKFVTVFLPFFLTKRLFFLQAEAFLFFLSF